MENDNIEEVRTSKNEDGEFTNIDMKRVVNMPSKDKETKETEKSESGSNLKKILLDHWILISVIALIAVVLIGLIILSVVLTRSHSGDNVENLVERVDCVPWLRGKSTNEIYVECHKLEHCLYQAIPDLDGPVCVYDNTKLKLRRFTTEMTSFGEKHLLSIPGKEETKAMVLEFEYLDDVTLRFKVW